MSRILLADDSPHAQRMGERILREEGFEVVTVTDGETALVRLPDVDPDLVMADVFLPHRSGYEICQYVKNHPRYRHARVILLAGLLEPVDESEAERVRADAVLKKPFEASALVATIRPLIEAALAAREAPVEEAAEELPAADTGPGPSSEVTAEGLEAVAGELPAAPEAVVEVTPPAEQSPGGEVATEGGLEAAPLAAEPPAPAETAREATPPVDAERVRAAVTIALDRAMPAMIDEITERVLVALGQ
jgi:CheY-like chemotaxis protein